MRGKRVDLGPGLAYGYFKNLMRSRASIGNRVNFNDMLFATEVSLRSRGLLPISEQGLRNVIKRLVQEGALAIVSERGQGKTVIYEITPKMNEETNDLKKEKVVVKTIKKKLVKDSQTTSVFGEIDQEIELIAEKLKSKMIVERMPAIVAKIREEQERAIAVLIARVEELKRMAESIDSKAYAKSAEQAKKGELLLGKAEKFFRRAEDIRKRATDKVAKLDKVSEKIATDIKSRIAEIEEAKVELSRLGCVDCNAERKRIREIGDRLRQAQDLAIRRVVTGESAVHSTGRDS